MNKNAKIAILGAGVEGGAMAEYLLKKGYTDLTILDRNLTPEFKNILPDRRTGADYMKNLIDFDIVFRSPGIPCLTEEIQEAKKEGVEISSLTKYFFEHCPCPIIGVTGTKGKGTTSALIAHILETAGHKVFLGGNIGKTPIEFLDKLSKNHYVVLELSSFQLQDLEQSPHIAVLLGITSDHLDYHRDREEYVRAKQNIVRWQKQKDIAIYGEDDKTSRELVGISKGKHVPFSTQKSLRNGCFIAKNAFLMRREKDYCELCSIKDVRLVGPHNLQNVAAAIAVAGALDIPPRLIGQAVGTFSGLPHRLQLIKKINGVSFYDDSYSTNPDTAIAAIRSFKTPTVLIVGGSDKGASYAGLGTEIVRSYNLKTVISIGETSQKIEAAVDAATEIELERIADAMAREKPVRSRETPLEFIRAQSFPEACMVARLIAQKGDTVLLSPASASFDMFKNAAERGEVWQNFIKSIR